MPPATAPPLQGRAGSENGVLRLVDYGLGRRAVFVNSVGSRPLSESQHASGEDDCSDYDALAVHISYRRRQVPPPGPRTDAPPRPSLASATLQGNECSPWGAPARRRLSPLLRGRAYFPYLCRGCEAQLARGHKAL